MATARISSQCSKCKDAVGVFNCAGCKEIFCLRHSMEHRQALCTRFEQLMTEHNTTLQQMQDTNSSKELLKKDFNDRIDEWKNAMIEKVCQRAEEIRQQLDEQIDRKNKTIAKNVQLLAEEIHQRYEKEDFFEDDIERIQRNIKEVQQAIEKSTQQLDIELCIERNEKVNWENLIYIQEKSDSASSSVTKKATRNSIHSEQVSNPYEPVPNFYTNLPQPNYPFLIPIIRQSNEPSITVNLPQNPVFYPMPPLNPSASNLSVSSEKRSRTPLTIVDPVSHKTIQLKLSTDINQNSS